MKNYFFILLTLLLVPFGVYASQEINISDPSSIIIWLSPLLTLIGTWIIKRIPIIRGGVTLFVVPLLSALIAWLSDLVTEDENTWTVKFLAGLGSVLIHQIYKNYSDKK